jgi:hypothetical protein
MSDLDPDFNRICGSEFRKAKRPTKNKNNNKFDVLRERISLWSGVLDLLELGIFMESKEETKKNFLHRSTCSNYGN